MIARVERAVRSVGEIGRVHVCRWGDGSEHLHWWFLARPARLPQLKTNLVAIWDDVLPPLPEDYLAREPRSGREGARMTYDPTVLPAGLPMPERRRRRPSRGGSCRRSSWRQRKGS